MELSEKEVAELKARVTLVNDVVVYREMESFTLATLELMVMHANEMVSQTGTSALIVDLTQTRRPNPRVREQMRLTLVHLLHVRHLLLVTGKNAFMNVGVRFIFSGSLPFKLTVHRTMEAAMESVGRDE